MPSATRIGDSMVSPSARKRRRDGDGEIQMPFSPYGPSQHLISAINKNERLILPSNRASASALFNVPRKVVPLPMTKKLRLDDNHHEQSSNHHMHHDAIPSPTYSPSQHSHFPHAHPDLTSAASTSPHQARTTTTRTSSSTLLSPCHICHRKPLKKSDLDSFADCMGCGERTCFVCIRACQGWPSSSEGGESNHAETEEEQDLSASFTMQDVEDEDSTHHQADEVADSQTPQLRQKKGNGGGGEGSWNGRGHRGVICSQCCVERGSEGDVVCLGCLAMMEGA